MDEAEKESADKTDNAKMAKQTVTKAAYTLHENILGKDICTYWAQLGEKHGIHCRLE